MRVGGKRPRLPGLAFSDVFSSGVYKPRFPRPKVTALPQRSRHPRPRHANSPPLPPTHGTHMGGTTGAPPLPAMHRGLCHPPRHPHAPPQTPCPLECDTVPPSTNATLAHGSCPPFLAPHTPPLLRTTNTVRGMVVLCPQATPRRPPQRITPPRPRAPPPPPPPPTRAPSAPPSSARLSPSPSMLHHPASPVRAKHIACHSSPHS
jgi:hypothetical protein